MTECNSERRQVEVVHGPRSFTLSWYMPGTTAADLYDTIAARLRLPTACAFTVEEATGGGTVALSTGMPSGLTLHIRLEPACEPSHNDLARPMARATARAHRGELCEPLLKDRCEADSNPEVAVDAMLKLNRITSALANERTFLAWLRTTCSMFALAISLNTLDKGEHLNWRWLGFGTGLVVTALGAVSYAHSVERFFRIKAVLLMETPPSRYRRRSLRPFTVLVGAVWLAVVTSYVVRGLFMQHIMVDPLPAPPLALGGQAAIPSVGVPHTAAQSNSTSRRVSDS